MQPGLNPIRRRLAAGAGQVLTGVGSVAPEIREKGTMYHGSQADAGATVTVYNDTEVIHVVEAPAGEAKSDPAPGGSMSIVGPLKVDVAGGSATVYFGYQ